MDWPCVSPLGPAQCAGFGKSGGASFIHNSKEQSLAVANARQCPNLWQ